MPSCQPLKASFLVFTFFTPLIFVLFHIYLFIYTKSFGVCPYLLKMSRCIFFFFFSDALGDAGEYLKKKYIGRGVRKVFKELKAQGKRIILFSLGCPACSETSVTGPLGGLWKLWCLMLKLCSKQSLPGPV